MGSRMASSELTPVRARISICILVLFGGFATHCSDTAKWDANRAGPPAQRASHTETVEGNGWSMPEKRAREKARAVLDTLTLREKIGQLFFIAAEGRYMHREDERYIDLTEKIRSEHVGGILFFRGSVYPQAQLTNRLQQVSPLPLWITQDMEFGAAMRVNRTTTITPAMGIAAGGNEHSARLAGFITAMEAGALGVHQIFAPVVDINNNPNNPVINVRSFGGTPELVSRFSSAFIKGAREGGVMSTAKHFPGHGDTHIDSHLRLPIINANYQQLNSLELIPFRSAIDAGVESIMSAHISFPEIGGKRRLPATMDPAILDRILRDSLRFDGLVVTDALEMQGVTDHYSPGEAALQSIQAGSDILLISPDATAAIHHIREAVRDGRLPEKRINRSVLKLLTLKFREGLFDHRTVNLDQLSDRINPPEYQKKAEQIARQSITVLSNRLDILPLHSADYNSICAVALADDKSGNTGTRLREELRKYHNSVRFHTFDRRSGAEEKQRIRRCARQADLLVIGSFIYVKTYQDITINREQRLFIESLSNYSNPEVLISFGNPYIFKDIPHAEVDMQAWAPFNIQVDAAVEALFGASGAAGKMPIRFPGHFERGDGLEFPQSAPNITSGKTPFISGELTRTLHRKISGAISDSLFPGASLMIMDEGRTIYHSTFGYEGFEKQKQIKSGTRYALPGLASELAAAPHILQSLQEGNRSLEMYDTELQQGIGGNPAADEGEGSALTLHSTTRDIGTLVFTLMNGGRYKNLQLFPDTLSNRFIRAGAGTNEPSPENYKQLGNDRSRIWIDSRNKRAVLLFLRPSPDKKQQNNENRLESFRSELLRRIDNELQ